MAVNGLLAILCDLCCMRIRGSVLVALLALPMSVTGIGAARAASAVAASVDNFGYCYQMPNARQAVQCALQSCSKRSRQRCRVITACAKTGHGAVFLRLLPSRTIEAIGAACGAGKQVDAYREAARRCNKQAKSNECRGPHGAWFDKAR